MPVEKYPEIFAVPARRSAPFCMSVLDIVMAKMRKKGIRQGKRRAF